jgi:peptidyl-prolyl cis-trans isomerase B (cyclophilin B)
MQIDSSKMYRAMIETNKGGIEVELSPQHAPKTVNNFVFLAREGFYDGVSFHRVISDFMIQGEIQQAQVEVVLATPLKMR